MGERASRCAGATASDIASRDRRKDAIGGRKFSEISSPISKSFASLNRVLSLFLCHSFTDVFFSPSMWARPRTYILRSDWLWPALWMLPVNETNGPWPLSGTSSVKLTGRLLSSPLFFCPCSCQLVRGLRMSCYFRYHSLLLGETAYAPPSLCTVSHLSSLLAVDHGIAWQRPTVPCTVRPPLFHLLLGVDFDTASLVSTPTVVPSSRGNSFVRGSLHWGPTFALMTCPRLSAGGRSVARRTRRGSTLQWTPNLL
jgi:hypothetical protein